MYLPTNWPETLKPAASFTCDPIEFNQPARAAMAALPMVMPITALAGRFRKIGTLGVIRQGSA